MGSRARSVTIAAAAESVFRYVSRAENLPQWAHPFAESVRPEDDHWIATTPRGEFRFALQADEASGTVDILTLHDPHTYELRASTRVVRRGPGQSQFLFTLLPHPQERDTDFEKRLETITSELETLRRVLESGFTAGFNS